MTISRRMLMGAAGLVDGIDGVDLDGTNDYLNRTSDFSGNADGKTFTMSGWVYYDEITGDHYIYSGGAAAPSQVQLIVRSDRKFEGIFKNSGSTVILSLLSEAIPVETWTHFVLSVDMANASNRYLYINDNLDSTTWSTYTNDSIDFTNTDHSVGARFDGSGFTKGRLSHIFLDYTYRDLSSSVNRRLFTALDSEVGLSPASGQAALDPIFYLQLNNINTLESNLGTGGDFTLNGTVAISGRGVNQHNKSACEFDGVSDYLADTSISYGASGDVATISFSVKCPSASSSIFGLQSTNNGITFPRMRVYGGSTDYIRWVAEDSSGTNLNFTLNNIQKPFDKINHVSMSIDMTDSLKTVAVVNGSVFTDTSLTHNGRSIDWSAFVTAFLGKDFQAGTETDVIVGDFYFDTSYIDLSTTNPFWDDILNKPAYLGESGELPTSSSPLVYLPLRGDDAGSNLGTGGDFTVTSGPFTGKRGVSEFWARTVEFDGSTDHYNRSSALSGSSNTKTFTVAFGIRNDSLGGTDRIFTIGTSGNTVRFSVYTSTTTLTIDGFNSGGTQILSATVTTAFSTNTWSTCIMSVDLSNASNREIVIDNTATTPTWTTYSDDSIDFSESKQNIGANLAGTADFLDGELGFLWFDNSYIDLTTESNRLKFIDAFNYPVDLGSDGSGATDSQPLVYMKFDDPDSLETNSGSGGDFTESGTPIMGADIHG